MDYDIKIHNLKAELLACELLKMNSIVADLIPFLGYYSTLHFVTGNKFRAEFDSAENNRKYIELLNILDSEESYDEDGERVKLYTLKVNSKITICSENDNVYIYVNTSEGSDMQSIVNILEEFKLRYSFDAAIEKQNKFVNSAQKYLDTLKDYRHKFQPR